MKDNNGHLKALRLKHGYTQQEVADNIGVTKATISKYEKGLRRVNHIEELAELFGVEPIYILTGTTSAEWQNEIDTIRQKHEEEDEEYWKSILLPDSATQMLSLLDMLNAEGQQKAVERVEELTEIPKYQRQKPQDTSKPHQEGKDTTPTENPPDAPQNPPAGAENK